MAFLELIPVPVLPGDVRKKEKKAMTVVELDLKDFFQWWKIKEHQEVLEKSHFISAFLQMLSFLL